MTYKSRAQHLSIFGLVVLWGLQSASARVPAEQAAQLGKSLTPYGAQQAGEIVKSGLDIPAWENGLLKKDWPADFRKPGQHHPDPFKDDTPLFIVTAKNMGQYEEFLTEGHKALLKAYPDTFTVPVYKSRRSHSAPQWVYDNIKTNAVQAELTADYNGVDNAYGGVAFPIINRDSPQAGVEALWNHITRFRGTYVLRDASEVAVQQNGDYQLVTSVQEVNFNYYKIDGNADSLNNILFYYLSSTHSPARLAGSANLIYEPLNHTQEARQAWTYNTGQRRVRRAPSLAFDAPIAASDGLRTADDTDMFNGSPERYDWSLIGVKNKIIPYNNYKLDDPKIKYKTILQKNHINTALSRHELHRVWIIEGQLKDGARHIYSKRRFYIDEDSWSIAVADQYDVRGNLWRVSVSYLKNYYDVPTTWSALDVFYDLQANRYHALFLDNEAPTTLIFANEAPDADKFTPQYLRRTGRR